MPINSFENYPMSWKPQKRDLEKPYYLSIASHLEKDILDGKLMENTKLPPQRELADFLDLNLSTITRAYKICELKGLLYAVTGKGTFVSPGVSVRDTFLARNRAVIEMGMIKPFYECNQTVLNAAQVVVSKQENVKLFEYSNPLGTNRQIMAAFKWLHFLGVEVEKENIMLAAGAQNALAVVMISLFKEGDKIAVDTFTYTNFKGLANFLRIQLVPVEADEFGMNPDALQKTCKNAEIKGVYLMPTCSNPTSVFMPMERRQEIADLVHEFDMLLIEDDIYSFLAPAGVKPFFSIIPEQTFHICSISKSLCAGLRVAFLAFPAKYKDALISGMLNINLKTVSLNGEIFAELIESGKAFDILRNKITLAKKRNQIFQSIFEYPVTDEVVRFFYWLPIPNHLTSEEVELLALKNGIHVLGSHRFAMRNDQNSFNVRVSIVSPDTEDDLKKGLLILRNVLENRLENFFV
jgi:DNA-binding transcriptional MocR family regulator